MSSLRAQLSALEGRVRHAYQDHLGYWTIGVGRLIDERKGGGLRGNEIDFLLDNDIAEKTAQVLDRLPWAARLDEVRMAVLVGMAFQMGINGLMGFTRTLAAIRDGHYAHAAGRMLDSLWAKQTPGRAKKMARQIETGQWQ